jgi:hypothetical protein
MKSQRIAFGLIALLVFLVGAFVSSQAGSSPPQPGAQPFLTELHLHGSLSEGRATMMHHSKVGSAADYDVLWWTDHMERITSKVFPQEIDFDNGLFSGTFSNGLLAFHDTGVSTNSIEGSPSPNYAQIVHDSPGTPIWTSGGLKFYTTGHLERISLMAKPKIAMDLWLPSTYDLNDTSVIVRVTLSSSRGAGTNDAGIPNVIEYIPNGMPQPVISSGIVTDTLRIPLLTGLSNLPTGITLNPWSDVSPYFAEGTDMSIVLIEVLAAGRNGKQITLAMDDFSLDVVDTRCNKALLVAAETLVKNGPAPYSNLTQHVGMEIAGPDVQEMTHVSTRDHVIALYREPIDTAIGQIYDFTATQPADWPDVGIQSVHYDGGVAILAHIFSATAPPGTLSDPVIVDLANRVVTNRAWQADGIEIGYNVRGAPMIEFLKVWDRLSADHVYITGVGVSDNHNVMDWNLRQNNMGTWLKADTDSAENLANAVQSGHAFFGDPYQFDRVHGDLTFKEVNDAFSMGDVVQIPSAGQTHTLSVDINGASPTDELVWYHNGIESLPHVNFTSLGTVSSTRTFNLAAGDWVRVEVHNNLGDKILFSNPIYFLDGSIFPPHRTPN